MFLRKHNFPPIYSPDVDENEPSVKPSKVRRLNVSSGHDIHCWKCHEPATDCFCSTCKRSYHKKCAERVKSGANLYGWSCGQCKSVQRANHLSLKMRCDLKKLNDTLKVVSQRLQVEIMACCSDSMHWSKLQEKLNNHSYKSTAEFIVDLKWIQHDLLKTTSNTIAQNAAKHLIAKSRDEISLLELCHECYSRPRENKNWFTEICQPPHQLVWAKMIDMPFWPAKFIEAKENQKIVVQFFGSHEVAHVKQSQIKQYSKENPNKHLSPVYQMDLNSCMIEVNQYINNYEKHGAFVYADSNNAKGDAQHASTIGANVSLNTPNDDSTTTFLSFVDSIRNENEKLKTELSAMQQERMKMELNDLKLEIKGLKDERDDLKKRLDEMEKSETELKKALTEASKYAKTLVSILK